MCCLSNLVCTYKSVLTIFPIAYTYTDLFAICVRYVHLADHMGAAPKPRIKAVGSSEAKDGLNCAAMYKE